MARQNRNEQTDSTSTEAHAEVTEENQTPTEGTSTEGTDAPAETPIDLGPFQAVVNEVVATRDTSTGVVSEEELTKVTSAYRELDGAKPKNAAKTWVGEQMMASVVALDGPLARAFADSQKALVAGGSAKKESTPADPTAAQVQREAALTLAFQIAVASRPEGVEQEKVDEAVNGAQEQVTAYRTWLDNEAEDKGDAPEVSPVVRSAFKLASGKASGGGRVSGGSGVRRDIGKHISEVFANVASGTELTVAEIANTPTSEYGKDNPPSQGAVSARLFPTGGGKCTVEGITPRDKTADKPRGATKI